MAGSLNLYVRGGGTGGSRAAAAALVEAAAVPIANVWLYEESIRTTDNMRVALECRAVIEQAKGILMERLRIPAEQAFEALARTSNDTNTRLRDVAQAVVDTGQIPRYPLTDAAQQPLPVLGGSHYALAPLSRSPERDDPPDLPPARRRGDRFPMTRFTARLVQGTAALAAVSAVLTSLATSAVAAVVGNDDLAQAERISALPYAHEVDLTDATTEPGEPLTPCDFVSNTVWYRVQLGADAFVRLDTAGSETDTVIAVFDDPTLSVPIACANNDGESVQAAVTFTARAGVEYLVQIGVDGQLGAQPGLLRLTAGVAPRPTGKPQVDGLRLGTTFAGAFFHTPLDEVGSYHDTQIDISHTTELVRGTVPLRTADVQFSSRRSVLRQDGVKVNDEWYYAGTVEPRLFRISESLAGASAELDLVVSRTSCLIVGGDVDPQCTEPTEERVTVRASWTGIGDVHRDKRVLADRGFGYRVNGTVHDTWRDAAVTAQVSGDLDQRLSDPFDSVLSRTSLNATHWTRD